MERLCQTYWYPLYIVVRRKDYPNIVPIYEMGECEGQSFFSVKFVEGGSLAQRISNRKFQISNEEAAGLLAKLARPVRFAHLRGILHRDIKPGNVLLDPQWEPLLTDFGLAAGHGHQHRRRGAELWLDSDDTSKNKLEETKALPRIRAMLEAYL